MKIALLTEIINRRSGARAPLEVAMALSKLGNKVTVFAFPHMLEEKAIEELKKHNINSVLINTSKYFAPFVLYKKLKEGKFDILSFHARLPFFLGASLSGLPIVRTYYGSQMDPILDKNFPHNPTIFIKLLNWMANVFIICTESILLYKSNTILAISKYTQQEVKKMFHYTINYIYLGTTLAPKSYKIKTKKNKTLSILAVSRIIPYKGFHILIKIFNRLTKKYPHIRLIIVGSSPDLKYLSYLRKISSKKITIKVNIPDEELASLYKSSDMYASYDRYMFFGMPLLEAAGFGLPTVAINACAAAELVKDKKTGFLAENEYEFEKKLELLIYNRKLRDKMSNEALGWSKKFSWDSFGKQYNKLLIHVIKIAKKKEPKNKFRKEILAVIAITILAAILRVIAINKHVFWFDEAFAFHVSQQSIQNILAISRSDNNPPLYFLLLHLIIHISTNYIFLRFFSVTFSILSIPLWYITLQFLSNKKIALVTIFFVAISQPFIYFASETRSYSLFIFEISLILSSYILFLKTQKKLFLFLYLFSMFIALYTHYYAIFFGIATFLHYIFQNKNKTINWVLLHIGVGILFIPWFIFLQYKNYSCWCFYSFQGLPYTFASFAINGLGIVTLKDMYESIPKPILYYFFSISIFLFSLFCIGIKHFIVQKKYFLQLIFFLPLSIISILSFSVPVFSPRGLVVLLPLYYLSIVSTLFAIRKTKIKIMMICCISLLVLSISYIEQTVTFFKGPDFEKLATFIKSHNSTDSVFVHANHITYYPSMYYTSNCCNQTFFNNNNSITIEKNKSTYVIVMDKWKNDRQLQKVKEINPQIFSVKRSLDNQAITVYYLKGKNE